MNLLRMIALAAIFSTIACGPSNPAVKAITGATLIDGTGSASIPDSVVIVNGNDIQAAGLGPNTPIPPDAAKLDVTGKFIIPGLIDVRAELPSDPAKAAPLLRSLLKAGITSIGVANGGNVARDVSPRTLPASAQIVGSADLIIASGGSTPADFFRKIDRMTETGLPPRQILAAATKNGAEWLKQDRLGVIRQGRKADLIILNADPMKDAHNLAKISKVMLDGTWIK